MSHQDHVPLDALLAHRPFVAALARALVRDPATADDLEQRAWLAAVERPPVAGGSVRAWFARVVRNAARETWRSRRRRDALEMAAARPDVGVAPDDIAARAEIHRRVVLTVFDLDDVSRRVVLLRFFEGLTSAEIAVREDVPPATVRKRLERALARLRDRLDEESDGDRSAWSAALAPLVVAATGADGGTGPDRGASAGATSRRMRAVAAAAIVAVGATATAIWRFSADADVDGAHSASADASDRAAGASAQIRRDWTRRAGTAPSRPTAAVAAAAETTEAPALPAGDLEVLVVSPQGEPVPGATAEVLVPLPFKQFVNYTVELPWRASPRVEKTVTTGDDGRAIVSGLAQGWRYVVGVADGYAWSSPEGVQLADRPTRVRIVLRRRCSVRGRVVDAESGAPLVAEVEAVATREMHEVRLGPSRSRTTSGADGTFRIERAPAEQLVVRAGRVGGLLSTGAGVDPVADVAVELRLPSEASVEGIAVDAADGRPVAGAALGVVVHFEQGPSSPARVRVVTDAEGRFRVDRVPVGVRVVVAPTLDSGWGGTWKDRALVDDAAQGVVTTDGLLGLRVVLVGIGAIEGTVFGADGRPAVGADVMLIGERVEPNSTSTSAPIGRTRTDASGAYRFDAPPTHVEVVARCGDDISPPTTPFEVLIQISRGGADPRVPIVSGQTTLHDVRLRRGLRIEGRVLDAAGAPVAGASVLTANRHLGGEFAAETESSVDGTFVLRGVLPEGTTPLAFAARKGELRGRADVAETGPTTIRVLPADATAFGIEGVVVGSDGAPVADVRLFHFSAEDRRIDARFLRDVPRRGDSSPVVVRRDGTFAVDGIDGRYRKRVGLVATSPGLLPATSVVDVVPGSTATGVRVVLRRGAEIRGSLVRHDGTPAAGVPVRAVAARAGQVSYDGEPATVTTAADGAFRLVVEPHESVCICFGVTGREILALPSAPPGAETVEARLPDDSRPRDERERSIATGPRAPRVPTLGEHPIFPVEREGARIERGIVGRVLDVDGRRVSGARVECTYPSVHGGGFGSAGSTTDDDGRFSFDAREGQLAVVEVDAGARGAALREDVTASATALEIRITRPPTPALSGVVRDEHGAPVAGAVVTVLRAWERTRLHASVELPPSFDELTRADRDSYDRRSVVSSAGGVFEVQFLPRGAYIAFAGRPGSPWVASSFVTFEPSGGVRRDLAVRAGATLRARVRDAEGRSRRGQIVQFTARRQIGELGVDFDVRVAADGDGRVVVPGLPTGPWRLRLAQGPDAQAKPVEVDASEVEVDVRF